ncbi:hypothetical protein [Candidatus Uabimicrobium sp. HlEnr_7]|uniref:hypothetical protein n=1 Tax=Candidatus Uabimicrobium helgolandensis TaxID=3095367 RepID=UPI003555EF6A
MQVDIPLLGENLGLLLHGLQLAQYNISIRHLQDWQTLLMSLTKKGNAKIEFEELCRYMAATVCCNTLQQQDFHNYFAQFCQLHACKEQEPQPTSLSKSDDNIDKPNPLPKSKRRWLKYFVGGLALLLLLLLLFSYIWYTTRPHKQQKYSLTVYAVNEKKQPLQNASIQLSTGETLQEQQKFYTTQFTPQTKPVTITITKDGYNTLTKQIQFVGRNVEKTYTLSPLRSFKLSVSITSTEAHKNPVDATVSFLGKEQQTVKGKCNFSGNIPQNQKTALLTVDNTNYKLYEQQITLRETMTTEVVLQNLNKCEINGVVVDKDNNPIQQVAINVLNINTTTANNNHFQVSVATRQEKVELYASHPQYAQQKVVITLDKSKTIVTIVMTKKNISLYSFFSQPSKMSTNTPQLNIYLWIFILSMLLVVMIILLRRFNYFSVKMPTLLRRQSMQRLEIKNSSPVLSTKINLPPIENLQKCRSIISNKIDYIATANKTANNAGLFTQVYHCGKIVPQYLVLIDHFTKQDHYAQWALEVVKSLQQQHLALTLVYFSKDPRFCFDPQSNNISLEELAQLYPSHRLLVFSDGSGFFHSITNEPHPWLKLFYHWSVRIFFTPKPLTDWGYRESVIGNMNFARLVMDYSGIKALTKLVAGYEISSRDLYLHLASLPTIVEEQPQKWLEPYKPPKNEIKQLLSELQQYLGTSGYKWLQACAVYPKLQWQITLCLGQNLLCQNQMLFCEKTLVRLIRLPWFRHGEMPYWLRHELSKNFTIAKTYQIGNLIQQLSPLGYLYITPKQIKIQKNIKRYKRLVSRNRFTNTMMGSNLLNMFNTTKTNKKIENQSHTSKITLMKKISYLIMLTIAVSFAIYTSMENSKTSKIDYTIKSINLSGDDIQNEDLARLKLFPNIIHLSLFSTNIDDKGLHYLSSLSLESLNVGKTRISNQGLANICNMFSRTLKILDLSENQVIDNNGLKHLQKLEKLEVFVLTGNKRSDERGIANLPDTLTELNLSSTNINSVENFKNFKITKLFLANTKVTNNIDDLSNFQLLTHLDLSRLNINNLLFLKNLTKLTYLNLSENREITNDSLENFKTLKKLTKLDLRHLSKINDQGLAHLDNISDLTTLLIDKTSITPVGISYLRQKFSNCNISYDRELNLNRKNIDNNYLRKYVSSLVNLVRLDLSNNTKITNAGLVHITSLLNLNDLRLHSCGIGDEGLSHLAKLTKLSSLQLFNTNVSGKGLKHLANLKELYYLNLGGNSNEFNNGLEHLKNLSKLRHLTLGPTTITKEGVNQLKHLEQLSNLNLEHTNISETLLEELKSLLPNCKISLVKD